ncbi:M23 family metallopeptidase [Neobacillus sp. PS3-12]|uniref:M23 family metallopeptidase n=1 Tax=Neobacillus sp. PS3-12 TaxID=3070677 RepID=UPI0027E20620|nr:M23 family metallopeptidase [Neobacillus sp. PS3-12]WML55424.1 M23 family metallopeptidase [Neobacillus sp. PS3-12]
MRFTNFTNKAMKLINSPFKKSIIISVTIAALAFHTNPVALANNSKLSTANDSHKVKKTAKAIDHKAQAAAIVIDGKPVVYLDSKNTAQDVIKKLKLQYVNEDQLTAVEAKSTSEQPLGQNETRILDLHLSADAAIEEVKAEPDQILSLDQAVSFLQKGTLEETKYKVKQGDVLGTIASEHQLKITNLIALNPGLTENSVLQIDQELNVTVPKPFVEVVVEKEFNQQEEIPYQTEVKEDPNVANGESKVSQTGQAGLQSVTYHVIEQNGTAVKKDVTKQDIIKQPVNQIVVKGTKVIPSRGEGSFAWPAVGGYISSTMGYRWGKLHKGIDIARPSNPTIKAADNGVVVSAGWDNGGYGNKIVINHQNGYQTVYAHLSSIGVKTGQTVEKGSAIGVMGATGDATGVHLHFEVYKNGALQDPLSYIKK